MSSVRPNRVPRRRAMIATHTAAGVVGIVFVVLVTLVAGTYAISSRTVNAQLDRSVLDAWQRVATAQGEPRLAQPGSTQPGSTQPGSMQPGSTQPGSTQPENGLPGRGQLERLRDPLSMPGLPVGTAVIIQDNSGTSVISGSVGSILSAVDKNELERFAQTIERGETRRATIGGQSYVMTAGTIPLLNGPPGQQVTPTDDATLILALPAASADQTNQDLLTLLIAASVIALTLVGVGAWLWIARSLRPLRDVAAEASAVSTLPLGEIDVDLSEHHLPDALSSQADEVGAVAQALNQLLASVDSAFAARAASEKQLRDFLADASHELRTPLAAVQGYAEMLQLTEPLSAEGEAMLTRVLAQSSRMNDLVEQLLVLARLDAAANSEGAHPATKEGDMCEVDLGEIVLDAAADAAVAHPDHNWVTDVPEEPVLLLGSPSYLTQMVNNLLSNAYKHTPPGTKVVISLERNSGGEVVLTVADNGPGIPEEIVDTVFNRFVRGDTARASAPDSTSATSTGASSTGATSTGLGLAIVDSVAQAHHGVASVRSVPGDTVFQVRFAG